MAYIVSLEANKANSQLGDFSKSEKKLISLLNELVAGVEMKATTTSEAETFKIGVTMSSNELEKKLIEMRVDLDAITCTGCKEKLKVDDIAGIHKVSKEFIFFCEKSECQIKASHKRLEIKNKK